MRYIVSILGLWLFAAAPSSPAAVPMVKTQAPRLLPHDAR